MEILDLGVTHLWALQFQAPSIHIISNVLIAATHHCGWHAESCQRDSRNGTCSPGAWSSKGLARWQNCWLVAAAVGIIWTIGPSKYWIGCTKTKWYFLPYNCHMRAYHTMILIDALHNSENMSLIAWWFSWGDCCLTAWRMGTKQTIQPKPFLAAHADHDQQQEGAHLRCLPAPKK